MKRKLLAATILVILVMIGILQILARPVRVNGRPIKPFVYRQIVLAERVTYFFNNPAVGDRIIFLPQDRDIEFVGIITNIEDNNNIRTYTVASGEKAAPWTITRDKILYRIYYPIITHEEVLQQSGF